MESFRFIDKRVASFLYNNCMLVFSLSLVCIGTRQLTTHGSFYMTLMHGRPNFTFHASEKVVSHKREEKLPRAKVLHFQRSLKWKAFSSIPQSPPVTMNGFPKSYMFGPSCSCAGLLPRYYDFLSQCLAIINIEKTPKFTLRYLAFAHTWTTL